MENKTTFPKSKYVWAGSEINFKSIKEPYSKTTSNQFGKINVLDSESWTDERNYKYMPTADQIRNDKLFENTLRCAKKKQISKRLDNLLEKEIILE